MSIFSRENPSPRHAELLGYYKEMHEKGAFDQGLSPDQTFDGRSMPAHAGNIRSIINVLGSQSILDYGAGKGKQYEPMSIESPDGQKFPDIKTFWNVASIECFDPGHQPFAKLPKGKFDGVVTTDVLEHCPKEDLPWIIAEIFGFATEFVYATVACYPAHKILPNGENSHCTVETPEWWKKIFDTCVRQFPGLRYFAAYEVLQDGQEGEKKTETILDRGKWNGK